MLPYSSLTLMRSLLAKFQFQLAAPGLSFESFFNHPITVQNERMLFRGADFIEIMAPIMSREFLRVALPYFDENFSAWGYEWLWRKLLNDRKAFAAILDAAPITHTRPMGQGSLYRNCALNGLTAEQEGAALIAKFGLDRQPFRSLFGITNDKPPRLLTGNELLHEMLVGYRQLSHHDFNNFHRCIVCLLTRNRPLATIDQLRCLGGFGDIESAICV
jgi:hypothetical protein